MIDYNVLKVIRGLLHTRSNGVDMTQISYSYIKQQEILDSIIGSVSPKQQKCKDWLIKESSKFLNVIKHNKKIYVIKIYKKKNLLDTRYWQKKELKKL